MDNGWDRVTPRTIKKYRSLSTMEQFTTWAEAVNCDGIMHYVSLTIFCSGFHAILGILCY